MAMTSPLFQSVKLAERVVFGQPDLAYAHPLDGGRAGIAHRDLHRTVVELEDQGIGEGRLFRHSATPMMLVSQPTVVDNSRRGAGGALPLWSYAHVPNGSTLDVTPGPGVHGMCGAHAATRVLKQQFGISRASDAPTVKGH
jgi:phytoene dehydrogenase-like protein